MSEIATEPAITSRRLSRAQDWLLAAGPIVLLLGGCLLGPLGTHSTNDAWIAVACGRYVVEQGQVPTTDPLSYTFAGKPFFNQNWLSHVLFYLAYQTITPGAVAVLIWLIALGIYGLNFYACRLRSRSWLAAIVATGIMAAASRHYVDVRPVTVGYFLMALTCALLHYFAAQREQRHWWPALLLFPVLVAWGNAHGSFVFGYGLVGMFVGAWLAGYVLPFWRVPASAAEIAAICGATAAALLATLVFGPYGLENFTHPMVVGGSPVFRGVVEWRPPFLRTYQGLEVWPFWVTSVGAFTALAVVGVLRLALVPLSAPTPPRGFPVITERRGGPAGAPRGSPRPTPRTPPPPQPTVHRPNVTWFDLGLVGVGLMMALFARRFAPLFYVLATPVLTTWIVRLALPLPRWPAARIGLQIAALTFGVLFGAEAISSAAVDLRPRTIGGERLNLLQRFVRYDQMPVEAIQFLRQIDTPVNVLSEWIVAGPIMVHAPKAKVFIDGRSQQVYTEQHYQLFTSLLDPRRFDEKAARAALDGTNTEAILLRRTPDAAGLLNLVNGSANWQPVFINGISALYLRRDSPALEQVLAREQAGQLVWPTDPTSLAARGMLLVSLDPPQFQRGIELMKAGVAGDAVVGLIAYPSLLRAWGAMAKSGDTTARAAGEAYFEAEKSRLQNARMEAPPALRADLMRALETCLTHIRRLPASTAPAGGI